MTQKWIVLSIALLMYVLVVVLPRKKAWISGGAAFLVLLLGVVTPLQVVGTLVKWNVVLVYTGSLIVAKLFMYSGVPERLTAISVRSRSGRNALLVVLIIAGCLSAFVENVSIIIILAPVVLALSKNGKKNPAYGIIALALMANLQGAATLIGDPPSIIFANFARYGFTDFFFYQGNLSIFFIVQAGMIAGIIYLYFFFTGNFTKPLDYTQQPIRSIIPVALIILLIAGLILLSLFNPGLTIFSGFYAIGIGLLGILWFTVRKNRSREETLKFVKTLNCGSVVYLIGLFIVTGAIADTGLLEDLALMLSHRAGSRIIPGFLLLVGVSAIFSGFIDTIPYLLVILPVAARLAGSMGLAPELYMFALLTGSSFGGNISPLGSTGNYVAMDYLRSQGFHIRFITWIKLGLPFTVITTTVSAGILWLLWR